MTTFTSNGKRRLTATRPATGFGNNRDAMLNDGVRFSDGALCLDCGEPVKRTDLRGHTPRYCDDCQRKRWRDRKRLQRSPLTCNECGTQLREPDPSGCCGLCNEEAALA